MSTHSALGVEMDDGSIVGCYVHFDGATMLPRIEDYLSTNTTTSLAILITRAQSVGGIRSFHCPPWRSTTLPHLGPPETELLEDNEAYAIDETNFFDDHMGTSAWYLVNYTRGSIEVREYGE